MATLDELFAQSDSAATQPSQGGNNQAALEQLFQQTAAGGAATADPLGGSPDQVQAALPDPTKQEFSQASPLELWERFQFSFGNDAGRRSFLQARFPDRKITKLKSGKMAVDGVPIDPVGFQITDLPGDIIDISDELVRLGGQILGAAKGAAVGGAVGAVPGAVVGTVAGGAAGRAGGQAAVETIGRAFGMQQEEVGQLVKDIAMEGAIGGVSEGVGVGLRAVGKPTVKFLRNLSRSFAQRAGRPFEQTILNFTGGMQQRNIERLQVKGAKNILTSSNLDDSALLNIGKKVQTAAVEQRKALGRAVEEGKGIIKNITEKNINITDIRSDFTRALQNLNLLGKGTRITESSILDQFGQPARIIEENVLKAIKPTIGKLDAGQKQLVAIWSAMKKQKRISPADALRWRQELDRLIKFGQVGKHVVTNSENALMQSLRGELKNKLIQSSDEFARVNKDFASFAQIEEALTGKLNLQSIEGFLKNVFTGQQFFEDSLIELNRRVKPEQRFLERLKDVVAARDFASTTFRGIRTGIFSGLLGGVFGGGAGFFPGAAAGIALSTPRIAGKAIAGRQALSKLAERGLTGAGQAASGGTPGVLAALLSKARGAATPTAQ